MKCEWLQKWWGGAALFDSQCVRRLPILRRRSAPMINSWTSLAGVRCATVTRPVHRPGWLKSTHPLSLLAPAFALSIGCSLRRLCLHRRCASLVTTLFSRRQPDATFAVRPLADSAIDFGVVILFLTTPFGAEDVPVLAARARAFRSGETLSRPHDRQDHRPAYLSHRCLTTTGKAAISPRARVGR